MLLDIFKLFPNGFKDVVALYYHPHREALVSPKCLKRYFSMIACVCKNIICSLSHLQGMGSTFIPSTISGNFKTKVFCKFNWLITIHNAWFIFILVLHKHNFCFRSIKIELSQHRKLF